jgi:hypothetical protein
MLVTQAFTFGREKLTLSEVIIRSLVDPKLRNLKKFLSILQTGVFSIEPVGIYLT